MLVIKHIFRHLLYTDHILYILFCYAIYFVYIISETLYVKQFTNITSYIFYKTSSLLHNNSYQYYSLTITCITYYLSELYFLPFV